ncbi:MAG: acylphosphatase [Phycisphaeraceae bacterium]
MIRKTVYYTGRVQGVGFRFTAHRLAQRFAVAGWVQNLDDGRVRLDAQGEADQVNALLDAVDQAMGLKIVSRDVTDAVPSAELGDPTLPNAFAVRR